MATKNEKSRLTATAELRRRANEQLREQPRKLPAPRSDDAAHRLVHELEVHQIELEMQNEELLRTQEELELSRNKYSQLYDFAPVGYFTFDAHGLIREVNHAGALLLGIERQQLADKPFIRFIPVVDDRTLFINHLEAVLQRQGMQRCEIRLKGRDGRVIHGQLQSDTIDIIDSNDGYILSSIVDGTAAKLLEEERAKLALIVESSNDAIFSVSLDDNITSWNSGAEKVFGYSAREIIGKQIFTIVPGARYQEKSHILHTILRGEQIQNFVTTRIRKDGSQLYVSITISPLLDVQRKINGYSIIARDVTEHKKMEEIVKHLAYHDTLTDLPNRQLFMDLFALGLAQARRYQKKLALLFLDLNGFKQVNDTLGHSCGDRLLQEVARRLKSSIRDSDTVARLGGDEFTVLMPDLAQTGDVSIVLRKIMGVFAAPFLLDDLTVETTVSIGVSMYPEDGESSEELMKKADSAMYDAKGTGRNSYRFYNAEINTRFREALAVPPETGKSQNSSMEEDAG